MSLIEKANSISVSTDGFDSSAIENISSMLKEFSSVCLFLKDYANYYRIPSLASFTSTSIGVLSVSSSKFTEKYEDKADKLKEKHDDKIKKICGKDNVKKYCEKNDMLTLKKSIDKERESVIDEMVSFYTSNPGGMTYCCKGRVADFMLYDQYLDHIENFDYNSENPYVVELYNALNDFLGTRERIEFGAGDIDTQISKFNEECDDVLKSYWNKEAEYFDELENTFKFDFYTNSEDSLEEAQSDDNDSVTLYSKVLSYLKSLVDYVAPQDEAIEYEEGKDYTDTIDSGIESTSDDKMEKKLKHLALMFSTIRRMKESSESEYTAKYISESNIEKVRKSSVKDLLSAYDGTAIDPVTLANKELFDTYLSSLKAVTTNESNIIDDIVRRAIAWYKGHYKSISDMSFLKDLVTASMEEKGELYKDNEKCDYFVVKASEMINDSTAATPAVNAMAALGYPEETTTAVEITDIRYWLKYCSIASLVNCMMPIYWSTGLILPSGPLKLPIVLIPFVVIPGRVMCVIGLGICGLAIYPMILFPNIGCINGCVLVPINMLIDMAQKKLKQFASKSIEEIVSSVSAKAKALEKEIEECDDEIKKVDDEIVQVQSMKKDKKLQKQLQNEKTKKGRS